MEEKTNQNTLNENATKKTKQSMPKVDLNEAVIQGRIVHKYAADKATILTISTGRATISPDYPKVVFFGSMKDEANKYSTGSFVKVVGNIQSSRRNPKIKNQMTLSIFGETIEPASTQFEEDHGIPGTYANVINHFRLAGTITAIDIPAKNIVRLTVRCVKNKRQSFVTIIYFSKNPANVIAEHLPGSFVRVSGSVQTTRNEKRGETRYFQNYVASELK